MRLSEHVGALSHEVDPAKDDVVRCGSCRSLLRQLERVAAKIGVTDDFIALVVVSEH